MYYDDKAVLICAENKGLLRMLKKNNYEIIWDVVWCHYIINKKQLCSVVTDEMMKWENENNNENNRAYQ